MFEFDIIYQGEKEVVHIPLDLGKDSYWKQYPEEGLCYGFFVRKEGEPWEYVRGLCTGIVEKEYTVVVTKGLHASALKTNNWYIDCDIQELFKPEDEKGRKCFMFAQKNCELVK